MENKPLVSIVMPTYNRGYIIEKAILSAVSQTYANWELIIVDDASTDETESVVAGIRDDRIRYVKNEINRGANFSRNRGCSLAKGDYLAFLDSDNYWGKEMLESQMELLVPSSAKVGFVFCRVRFQQFDKPLEEGKVVPREQFDSGQINRILPYGNMIDMNTVVMKKEAFCKVNGFDEEMPRLQDYELFLRLVLMYDYKVLYNPQVLDTNVIQGNSISMNMSKLEKAVLLLLKKYAAYFSETALHRWIWELICGVPDEEAKESVVQKIMGIKEIPGEHLINRQKFVEDFKKKSGRIYVYGMGERTQRALPYLGDFFAYLVSDGHKGQDGNKPIFAFSEADIAPEDGIILCLDTLNLAEVIPLLENKGHTNYICL